MRRECRIELFMESFRWEDLMRWKEVQKVVQEFPGYVFSGCRRMRSGSGRRHRLVIFIEEPAEKQNGVLYQTE
ncbi:RagB/SusD family nutrient uptake outer membrane protein [Catalinimonas niigatensis]|uniref:RagB/SusD family nutrient uptake outer membrane protein n=1 Tax=Catalinimonas niigatensis TaxID=1397264 RepID=UPI003898F22D